MGWRERCAAGHSGHTTQVTGCAISGNGQLIVSASWDNTVKVWDGASGALIMSASWDQTVKVWNGASGALLHTLSGHNGAVNGCAISSDGSLVVSASDDQTVKVWDVRSGECLANLYVDGPLVGCAFYGNGDRIITAGARGFYFLRLVR